MPLLSCSIPLWCGELEAASPLKAEAADDHFFCEVGVVKEASGSSFLRLGGASVVCSVHGPRTLQRGVVEGGSGSVDCDLRYAPFSVRPASGVLPTDTGSSSSGGGGNMTAKEKHLAQAMKEALLQSIRLELYPKMTITISVLVLQSSGNSVTDLAAAITSASLSLVDAMIETLDFVTAAAVGGVASKSIPGTLDTIQQVPTLMVALLPCLSQMSQVFLEGKIDAEAMPGLLASARREAETFRVHLSNCIKLRKKR